MESTTDSRPAPPQHPTLVRYLQILSENPQVGYGDAAARLQITTRQVRRLERRLIGLGWLRVVRIATAETTKIKRTVLRCEI